MQRLLIPLFIFLSLHVNAQQDSLAIVDSTVRAVDSIALKDSLRRIETIKTEADSLYLAIKTDTTLKFDSVIYSKHPFYSFREPIRRKFSEREWKGKEMFFYSAIGLLIFFAVIKNAFPRYLQDILKLFFRVSIRQRQVKEQLTQAPLPSLLLNVLFVVAGGMYIALVFDHYKIANEYPYWIVFTYAIIGLTVIYFVKYITIKLIGWIFRLKDAADTYIFIVFTTNKILGIAFLLFIIILAFTEGVIKQSALSLSFLTIIAFFLYRFFLAFTTIHRQLKIEFIHFLLYLLAFEIVPLLLINKLLLTYLG